MVLLKAMNNAMRQVVHEYFTVYLIFRCTELFPWSLCRLYKIFSPCCNTPKPESEHMYVHRRKHALNILFTNWLSMSGYFAIQKRIRFVSKDIWICCSIFVTKIFEKKTNSDHKLTNVQYITRET